MFFAHCSTEMFADCEPQTIEINETMAKRLTPKQLERARGMVDGKVNEVDWDVGKSSNPVAITRKFPFNTGVSERVKTADGDKVFYAQVQRRGRPIWGRFVRGRKPMMSRSQTVILRPVCDVGPVGWNVVAAYIGETAPPFPGDPFEQSNSRYFWSQHALLDGTMPYSRETVTTVCPWTVSEKVAA